MEEGAGTTLASRSFQSREGQDRALDIPTQHRGTYVHGRASRGRWGEHAPLSPHTLGASAGVGGTSHRT